MTVDQFITAIKEMKARWVIQQDCFIRQANMVNEHRMCLVEALAYHKTGMFVSYREGAVLLGLSNRDLDAIVNAADYSNSAIHGPLRAKFMEACKLGYYADMAQEPQEPKDPEKIPPDPIPAPEPEPKDPEFEYVCKLKYYYVPLSYYKPMYIGMVADEEERELVSA